MLVEKKVLSVGMYILNLCVSVAVVCYLRVHFQYVPNLNSVRFVVSVRLHAGSPEEDECVEEEFDEEVEEEEEEEQEVEEEEKTVVRGRVRKRKRVKKVKQCVHRQELVDTRQITALGPLLQLICIKKVYQKS